MSQLESYLKKYSESHQNKTNILIHKVCVPLIMFSTLGLLKAMPVPESWPMWLDLSTLAIALMLLFYASLRDLNIFLSMLLFITFQVSLLELLRPRFFLLCLFIFIFSWIFQFLGHKIEGKKPSFFEDLQFLLIGPIWVVIFFQKMIKEK